MVVRLSVQVRVEVRARDREWILFLLLFSVLKSDQHPPHLAPTWSEVWRYAMSLVAI